MGNVLEFYLKMKDMMSSGLVQVAKNAKGTFAQVENAVKKVEGVGKSAFAKIADATKKTESTASNYKRTLGSLYDRMNDLKRFRMDDALGRKEIVKTTNEVKKLQSEINKLEGKKGGGGVMRGMLGKAASIVAPLAIAGSLMSFGSNSLQSAMQFQAQKTSFGVLTGSKTTGDDLTNSLRGLKQDTIMGPAVYKNAQTMLGFGIEAKKVVPDLKMLGDVSMGDADKLGRLTLAFSQVSAAGRLTGQDLLQFINAGFNPLGEISRKTGKSFAVLKKEMKDGKVTFAMVEDAFKSATGAGGRFNGMLDTLADTTMGKMKKMEGQWAAFKIDTGEALMPLASGFMDAGSSVMKFLDIHKSVPQTLTEEKASINGVVRTIMGLNEHSYTRINLITKLKNSYPDLFGKLDAEKTSNNELIGILENVNQKYRDRIGLATSDLLIKNEQEDVSKYSGRLAHYTGIKELVDAGKLDEAHKMMKWSDAAYLTTFSDGNFKNPIVKKWLDNEIFSAGGGLDGALYDLDGEKKNKQQKELTQGAESIRGFKNYDVFKGHNKELADFKHYQSALADNNAVDNETYNNAMKWMNGGFGKVGAASIPTGEDVGGGGKKSSRKTAKESSQAIGSSITSSGPRTINIHGVKFCDKVELHQATVKENAQELETVFNDMFLRVLNSGASVQ